MKSIVQLERTAIYPASHYVTRRRTIEQMVPLVRDELIRVAVRAQDALAVCLRPGHTRYDGDAAFAVSCGEVSASVDLVGEAAFVATGRAIEAAMQAVAVPDSG